MKLYTEEEVRKLLNEILMLSSSVEDAMDSLIPIELLSDKNIWEWWQTQQFQKEQGEQEYTMLYEIDLPKILKAFIEHLKIKGGNNE